MWRSTPIVPAQPRPLPVDAGDGFKDSPGGNPADTGSDGRALGLTGTAGATPTALGGVVFLSVRRTRRRRRLTGAEAG
ncbi:hypothetical protein ABZY57_05625 [Streptomyces sp. NPDC006450]|uniref:hypothetical protein n=1 Tax=Streptomyces sp. NPDC006450 TaxID=3155458 RepID=UPI0033B96BB5